MISAGSRQDFFEHSNEYYDSTKGGEFLDHLNNYRHFKKDPTLWGGN
jgi:hypothetical protein